MSTPFLDEVYSGVDFERELVFKFFTVFSLFEYALKNTRYRSLRYRKVDADWESFALDIIQNFIVPSGSDINTSVNYLLRYPPKKQIIDANDQLTFEPRVHRPIGLSDTVWLSRLIRRVRNNLFHGGKFQYERPRDTKLIKSCLVILEAWAHLLPEVESELRNAR